MPKDVQFGTNARERMLEGVNILGNAVGATIGPKGRNVILEQTTGQPLITNDGVTIAKSITLPDPYQNMGAMLVAQAAAKTNDLAGDGTTTATVLTQAMINKGHELLEQGQNPVDLREGIQKAAEFVSDYLVKTSKKIDTNEEIAQVASVSSADKAIGQFIADAMDKVGKDGVITMEESRGLHTELEVLEGMEWDRGYMSPYMVTNPERMEAVYHNPYILVTSHKLSTISPLLPLLEEVVQTDVPLLIIADDVEGETFNTLVMNAMQGSFKVVTIKAPGFGDRRKDILEDIAVATGATFFNADLAMSFEEATVANLGRASKIIVTRSTTTIIEGQGDEFALEDRKKMIEAQIEQAKTEVDEQKLRERLAKLSGGVAVIKVGAATEAEMKERKMRIEDALNATKAAVKEGIVAGGGYALLRASEKLAGYIVNLPENEVAGASIVHHAILQPFTRIVENAGQNAKVITHSMGLGLGYNAATGEFVNLIEDGVIDPVTVTRSAVQNAASIASLYLTTEVAVTNIREKADDNSDITIPLGSTARMVQ